MLTDHYSELKFGRMPIRKKLEKKGTIKIGTVETTPVVWNGELLYLEWLRGGKWGSFHTSGRTHESLCFTNLFTNESGPEFAIGRTFPCAYQENGKMYVFATRGPGNSKYVDLYISDDLINWTESNAITLPYEDMGIYNTSVCKAEDRYIMAIEVGGSNPIVGAPFTHIFAESKDLINWTILPPEEYFYTPDYYSASTCLRYYDGYFYFVYLEKLPHMCWAPYIARSRDLKTYQIGATNPFMIYDDGDKKIPFPERFTQEEIEEIQTAINCNDSDIDMCEYQGKTIILYAWGNQLGKEYLAYAEYDGSEQELLESYFM